MVVGINLPVMAAGISSEACRGIGAPTMKEIKQEAGDICAQMMQNTQLRSVMTTIAKEMVDEGNTHPSVQQFAQSQHFGDSHSRKKKEPNACCCIL